MFVRANLFHEMGGLDEDFFAHMEEIDLCWKLSRSGYKIYYNGNSTVYHVGGGTLSASNPRKTYFNFRNGLSLLLKHQRLSSLVWKLPLRIFLDWTAAAHFFVTGSRVHAKAVIIAHLSFIARFGHEMKKRALTGKQIQGFKSANIYGGLIVFDYFVSRRKTYKNLRS
jgi:GT2 family glycosyltransferase